ncbi:MULTISPECIES: DUF4150 domain-containing protein [unclassified Mesorhizobium]|uniref:DUF4150 domain-containing protein n=1 Tax=unclassified Mesorhizobium TaxID=325217 RepID=UPI002477F6C5|nr:MULTISPECIES: DUF4150 domain-containing protein [unclassified Mesorhizobium]
MSNVFANGLEISGKAVQAQTIAAFPDVCFTPPQTPATPPGVPIPYPSFGIASDTENGTGKVLIGGKTVNIKNKSDISRTSGTEAGCAPKKGIVTSKNTGKKYFNSWSNNVKFEGEPVIRFTDLATHNHASPGGQTPPWPEMVAAAPPNPDGTKCIVGEYSSDAAKDCAKNTDADGNKYQFHHIVPDRTFRTGRRKVRGLKNPRDSRMPGAPSHGEGMCICLPPDNHVGSSKSTETAVHKAMDSKLTALGKQASTRANPSGVAKMSDVRIDCLKALKKLVPDVITAECFKAATKAVMEQTEPHKDRLVRAEKSLNNLSPTARGVLNKPWP